MFEVFNANVIVGNTIDMGPNCNRSLREPPEIPGLVDKRYDSIKGHTNHSDVYIVYKNVKTYPGLLIRY